MDWNFEGTKIPRSKTTCTKEYRKVRRQCETQEKAKKSLNYFERSSKGLQRDYTNFRTEDLKKRKKGKITPYSVQ